MSEERNNAFISKSINNTAKLLAEIISRNASFICAHHIINSSDALEAAGDYRVS
jgi:hypothetical protein